MLATIFWAHVAIFLLCGKDWYSFAYDTLIGYEPYSILSRQSIVALFPLDYNSTNILGSLFSSSDRSVYVTRQIKCKESVESHFVLPPYPCSYVDDATVIRGKYSAMAVQGYSLFFDGLSSLTIPLEFGYRTFPRITFGAWLQPSSVNGKIDEDIR
jgi:hypothetical protein